jgi:hypothetical protein
MSDRYGTAAIPLVAPDPGEAAADRALNVLCDFFKTFLNVNAVAAWSAVRPPKVPGSPTPGELPVNQVFTHDPIEGSFNEAALPALFFNRKAGKPEWMAEDYRVSRDEISMLWVFPTAPQAAQRVRDVITNGIVKLIDVAIERYRDPYWVHDRDKADADAFRLAAATSTSAQTYAGGSLDGIIGTKTLVSPRHFTVSSAVAVGAYTTASPILVNGLLGDNPVSDSLSLTTGNGGDMLEGTTLFDRITSIGVPAQALTSGYLSFGHAADAEALLYGSLLLSHSGFQSFEMKEWKDDNLVLKMGDGSPARTYSCVRVTFAAVDRWVLDMDEDFALIDGISLDIIRSDGTLQEQARYDAP